MRLRRGGVSQLGAATRSHRLRQVRSLLKEALAGRAETFVRARGEHIAREAGEPNGGDGGGTETLKGLLQLDVLRNSERSAAETDGYFEAPRRSGRKA